MNYESRHETLASIPNGEARGWKRIALAPLSMFEQYDPKQHPEEWDARYADAYAMAGSLLYDGGEEPDGEIKAMYLVGSRAKGTAREDSDYDWLVVGSDFDNQFPWGHKDEFDNDFIFTNQHPKPEDKAIRFFPNNYEWFSPEYKQASKIKPCQSTPYGPFCDAGHDTWQDHWDSIQSDYSDSSPNKHLYDLMKSDKPVVLYRAIRGVKGNNVDELLDNTQNYQDFEMSNWNRTWETPGVGIHWSDNPEIPKNDYALSDDSMVMEVEVNPRDIISYAEANGLFENWDRASRCLECGESSYDHDKQDEDHDFNDESPYVQGPILPDYRIQNEVNISPRSSLRVRAIHRKNGDEWVRTPYEKQRSVTAAQRIKPEDAQTLEQQMGEYAHKRGWQKEPTPYQDRSKIVHTFENGWTIRKPQLNGDAYREGELMSNCLSDDGGLLKTIETYNQDWEVPYGWQPLPDYEYLSLRDPNNIPHVTFNVDETNIKDIQPSSVFSIFGRHNASPKDSYKQMVLDYAHHRLGNFEEWFWIEGKLIASHSADRSCCGQSKVAEKIRPTDSEELERNMDYKDQSIVHHTFDNGWTIRGLDTLGDVTREGELMGNCLSDENRDVPEDWSWNDKFRDKTYLSLRDQWNLPHVTFELRYNPAENKHVISHMFGRHNSVTKGAYRNMILDFAHQNYGDFLHEHTVLTDGMEYDQEPDFTYHTADRRWCHCGQSKVAAFKLKPEHAEAVEREMNEIAKEEGWQDDDYRPYPDTSSILYKLDNGWTVRALKSIGDVFREGSLMGHCLEERAFDARMERLTGFDDSHRLTDNHPDVESPDSWTKGGRSYLSLRDKNNLPHLTFNIESHRATAENPDGRGEGYVAEFVGRHNSTPQDKYETMVSEFLHWYFKGKAYEEESWILDPETRGGDDEWINHPASDKPYSDQPWVDPYVEAQTKVAAERLKPEHAEAVEQRMGEMAKQYWWQEDNSPYEDQSTIAHTFDNGWTIRQLQSNGDAYREGELMSNCFKERTENYMFEDCEEDDNLHTDNSCPKCGGFGLLDKEIDWDGVTDVDEWFLDDYKQEKDPNLDDNSYAEIYSLRDENNLPHTSFSVIVKPNGLVLSDSFGRHNGKPKKQYEDLVNKFVNVYSKSKGHDSFEEYRSWLDEERGLKQHKVAADPQKEEQVDGQNMDEQQDEISAEQQQQMQALQKSNVFNHMVKIHQVDPEAAAELFFQSPVLLNQEHEREHAEGLIENHLPETLIVAKKVAAETKLQLLEKAKKLPNDTSKIVQLFDDGWSIRRPITVGDHFRESKLMSNCVYNAIYEPMAAYPKRWLNQCPQCDDAWKKCACEADDVYSYLLETLTDGYFDDRVTDYALKYPKQKANSGELVYYSLRDPNNIPHVSIGGVNGDSFGRHNSEVKDEYQKYLNAFDDEYPETLIVAKATEQALAPYFEPNDEEVHDLYRHSDCGSWAIAHQQEYPHLGLGILWVKTPIELQSSDDESPWEPYHAFTHDDKNAYDVTGTYPLKDIHLSAEEGCPRCSKGDSGIHTLGKTKITLNHSINDFAKIGFIDMDYLNNWIPTGSWIRKNAPTPKQACSCGSTQFRRVIDPLRTYARGGHDTYDYECRNCYKMAGTSDYQDLLKRIQENGGVSPFDDQLASWLGPRAYPLEEIYPDHPFFGELDALHNPMNPEIVPPYVFRVMSEEHFQNSLKDGFHQTDGRQNLRGQEKQDIEQGLGSWNVDDVDMNQGTVASIWPMMGYLSNSSSGLGRVVKIQIHPDDEWSLESSNDENRDWHTFKEIPVSRFVGWTPTIKNNKYDYSFTNEDGKRHIDDTSLSSKTAMPEDREFLDGIKYRLLCNNKWNGGACTNEDPFHVIYATDATGTDKLNNGKVLGIIAWVSGDNPDEHAVTTLDIDEQHRRKGLATRLWSYALNHTPTLQHSKDTTPDADEWIKSLNKQDRAKAEKWIELDSEWRSPVGPITASSDDWDWKTPNQDGKRHI